MPSGDKLSYTTRQKRMPRHIEDGDEVRGLTGNETARRAWATVNKQTGGGNLDGSGRGVSDTTVSALKNGGLDGKAAAAHPAQERSASASKAAATRKRRGHTVH